MIDSTKSPVPTWKRYLTIVVLAVLVLGAGYMLYTKDLKGSSSSSNASPPAATVPTAPSSGSSGGGSNPSTVPATTVPGGVAASNRDPFTP